MKQNRPLIKVIYCGDQYQSLFKEAVIKVEETVILKVLHSSFVETQNGKKYISGCSNIKLDDNAGG